MTRRAFTVFVALMLLVPVAGVAVAQEDTSTPTPTAGNESNWSAPGPYDLNTLRQGGTVPGGAGTGGVRDIHDDEGYFAGNVILEYKPSKPTDNDWKALSSGTALKQDQIRVRAVVSARESGDYELVVVFWNQATKEIQTENGITTRQYAANQSAQRYGLDIGNGRTVENISLQSHYGETKQVTMWIERNGQPVDGARWSSITHTTNPVSQQISFNTLTGALWFAIKNAILSGLGWAAAGFGVAFASLRRTGSSPRLGIFGAALLGVFSVSVLVMAAWYQLAVVLTEFRLLLGVPFFFVAAGGGMLMGNNIEKWQFERTELTEAKSLRSKESIEEIKENAENSEIIIGASEYAEGLYEDLPELEIVRDSDGNRKVAPGGLKEWLALLWAPAAKVTNNFETEVLVGEGRIDKKVYLDPEETDPENPVPYTRAHFERRIPVWNRLAEDADRDDKLMYGALTMAAIVGLPYMGWQLGGQLNIPAVGAAVALLPVLIESYGAVGSSVEINEASIHHRRAKQTVQTLQREQTDAKHFEEMEKENDNLRMQKASEMQDRADRRDSRLLVSMLADEKGVSPDVLAEDMERADLMTPPDPEEQSEKKQNGHHDDVEEVSADD